MFIPTYLTVIETLLSELDGLLKNFVFNSYSALVHYLVVPASFGVVLYIVFLGWSITQGLIDLSMKVLIQNAIKVGFIFSAAMHWGWFSHYIVNLIYNVSGQIGDVLIDATPIPIPHMAGTGIDGAMQTVLIEFTKIGAWIWFLGSWHNIGPFFAAITVWAFGYVMILVALFQIVLAKIMLSVLFSTAPLFILLALFPATKGFFDRWVGASMGFSFLMIMVSSVLALSLSIAQWAIGGIYETKAIHFTLVGFVPIMVVGFIGVGIIQKVASIAQMIGSVVTMRTTSLNLSGALQTVIRSRIPLINPTQLNHRSSAYSSSVIHDVKTGEYIKHRVYKMSSGKNKE